MSDYYDNYEDIASGAWDEAFMVAADKVLEICPNLDYDKVLRDITDAHTVDDPDWEFDPDRLVSHLLAGAGDWSDDTFDQLVELFPVELL